MIVALAVVFIPVLDFLMAVIRRTKDGRHPFSADKQHLHHRMLAIGHTHRQAVLIFYLWAFVLAGGAVSLAFVTRDGAMCLAVGVAIVLLFIRRGGVLGLAQGAGSAIGGERSERGSKRWRRRWRCDGRGHLPTAGRSSTSPSRPGPPS